MDEIPKRRKEDQEGNQSVLAQAMDVAIKITVWRNVRRYIVLAALAVLVVTLAVSLSVVLLVSSIVRDDDQHHAQVVCSALQSFAATESIAIQNQKALTAGLLRQGFTFGIPPDQFKALTAKSDKQRQQQLDRLTDIQRLNCTCITR